MTREEAFDYFQTHRLDEKVDRDFLLDSKTIQNIRNTIHAEQFRKHADPAMSLRYLVEDELGGVGGGTVHLYQEQQVEITTAAGRKEQRQTSAARQSVLLDEEDPDSILDAVTEEPLDAAEDEAALEEEPGVDPLPLSPPPPPLPLAPFVPPNPAAAAAAAGPAPAQPAAAAPAKHRNAKEAHPSSVVVRASVCQPPPSCRVAERQATPPSVSRGHRLHSLTLPGSLQEWKPFLLVLMTPWQKKMFKEHGQVRRASRSRLQGPRRWHADSTDSADG